MPDHTVPRYYKLFNAKKINAWINAKTDITMSFKKIERVVGKGLFLALSQQSYLNPTNPSLMMNNF